MLLPALHKVNMKIRIILGHLQIGCHNRIEPPTLPKQFCSFTMDTYISLAIRNLKVCLLIYTDKSMALAQMQKRLESKESWSHQYDSTYRLTTHALIWINSNTLHEINVRKVPKSITCRQSDSSRLNLTILHPMKT